MNQLSECVVLEVLLLVSLKLKDTFPLLNYYTCHFFFEVNMKN